MFSSMRCTSLQTLATYSPEICNVAASYCLAIIMKRQFCSVDSLLFSEITLHFYFALHAMFVFFQSEILAQLKHSVNLPTLS